MSKPYLRIIACCFLITVCVPAVADRAADRAEIQSLLFRYARALDTLDPDAYIAVYADNGRLVAGDNITTGKAALKQMIADVKQSREKRATAGEVVPTTYHMTTDYRIEFIDDTHASHHSYWVMFTTAKDNPAPRAAAVGRAINHVVKQNGQWLIEARDVEPRD